MKIKTILWSVSLAALSQGICANVASAQQTTPSVPAVEQDDTRLDEIVVTAQRREENVQRVPVAISVVTAERFDQIGGASITNLTALVPSLTFTGGNELRNQSIRIRGLGTDVFSIGVEPSTSTIVDGVVLQRGGQAFGDIADLARIEVLRGPQGTLFGKNSSAGALNIVTNDPTFDAIEGSVAGTVTTDGEYGTNFAVSGPVSDTVAFRLAGFAKRFDGNITNLNNEKLGEMLNGGNSAGARLKVLWRASETLELKLSADTSFYDSTAGALPFVIASSNPIAPITGVRPGLNNTRVNLDVSPYVNQVNSGVALDARLDLGEHTLFFTSAYRDFSNKADSDLDNTQGRVNISNFSNENSETFSNELRLVSPLGGLFDYVVGLYQFSGEVSQPIRRVGVNIAAVSAIDPVTGRVTFRVPGDTYSRLFGDNGPVKTENYGIFGQTNIHPTDRLTLTLGGRYIYEEQSAFISNDVPTFFNGSDRPQAPSVFVGDFPRLDSEDSHFIGKASVAYEFTPDILGYASYSTGYKGVGWNITPVLTPAQWLAGPAAPETSRQIEAGLKTRLFDNRLQLNVAAFSTRVEDYQGQAFQPTLGLTLLTSIGEVGLDGVEIEFEARPITGLSLSGGVSFLDASFVSGNAACFTGQTPANSNGRCFFVNGVSGTTLLNLEGLDFPNAPDVRITLGGRYEAPVAAGLSAFGQVDYRYQSDITFDISNNPDLAQEAYSITDLSAGLVWDNGLEASVFVKNVFEERFADGKINFQTGFIGPSVSQLIPRNFYRYGGVTVRYKF